MTSNTFNFDTTPGLRFGSGQAKDSCEEISKKLGSRIHFITDRGLTSLGLTKPSIEELNKITNTRFVIVTHHALTMSKMDRLYGVTMPEKGVSQLVAVDLQKAEELVA